MTVDPVPLPVGAGSRPSSSAAPVSTRFDLRGVEAAAWRLNRGRRRQAIGVIVFGPAIAAMAIGLAIEQGIRSGHFVLLLGVAALLVAMSAAMARFSGVPLDRGPAELRVGPDGLRFDWPDGRYLVRRWGDPHLRLELADYRGIPTPYRREVPAEIRVLRVPFAMTVDAVEACRDAAARQGLRVRSRVYEGGPGWRSLFYDVEPASADGPAADR